MWLAIATIASALISSSAQGGGGSGGGSGMGGGANAWSPSVGIANALFGKKGGDSSSVSDYGHMIQDLSGDRNQASEINFSPKFQWTKAVTFSVAIIAAVILIVKGK